MVQGSGRKIMINAIKKLTYCDVSYVNIEYKCPNCGSFFGIDCGNIYSDNTTIDIYCYDCGYERKYKLKVIVEELLK